MPDSAAHDALNPERESSAPRGRVGDVLYQGREIGKTIASWTPQQAMIVMFVLLIVFGAGGLVYMVWSADKSRVADREAFVAAQAQIIRSSESESEKYRMEMDKTRLFFSMELEKSRAAAVASEDKRTASSLQHMKDALQSLADLKTTIQGLVDAVNKLRGKVELPPIVVRD